MRIVGQEQVAAAFGVAPKTIVEWQEQGFPVALRGGPGVPSEYDLPDCIEWYKNREVRKVQGESPRDRLFRLQADALELDQAEKKGMLVRADSIEPRLRAAVIAAREALLRRAPRLAGLMEGRDRREREQLLRESDETFLRKLANWRRAEDELEAEADSA